MQGDCRALRRPLERWSKTASLLVNSRERCCTSIGGAGHFGAAIRSKMFQYEICALGGLRGAEGGLIFPACRSAVNFLMDSTVPAISRAISLVGASCGARGQ